MPCESASCRIRAVTQEMGPEAAPVSVTILQILRDAIRLNLQIEPSPGRDPTRTTSIFLMLCVGLVCLLLYRLTMPASITLEDAGLFQMVCQLGGISHPPGYPLFTSICQFALPPFGSSVLAGNMLSAIFASLACMVIYSCIHQMTSSMTTAVVVSLSYGFSATFWSQALIIEVYTFAVLGYVVCWRLLLAYSAKGNERYIYLAAFTFGLCLSNHWPLMVLSTPALVLGLWPKIGEFLNQLKRPIVWVLILLCFFAGLTPYATILFTPSPEIALIGEVSSVRELVPYILRSHYDVIDNQAVAGFSDKLGYLMWLTGETAQQLGIVALPVVLVGMYAGWHHFPKWMTLQLVVLLLGTTVLLAMLLNFSSEPLYHATYKPYPIIAYLPMAVWFGLGLNFLFERLHLTQAIKVLVSVVAVVSIGMGNLAQNDRHTDNWVEQHGIDVLESLPRNALYLASDSFEVGVLGYLNKVVGIRPDIELRSPDNQFFSNRLTQPFTSIEDQTEVLRDFLVHTERPFFAAGLKLEPAEYWGGYHRGGPPPLTSVVRNSKMDTAADRLLDQYDHSASLDAIEFNVVFQRLVQFTRQYVRLALTSTLTEGEGHRLDRLQRTFPGRLATLEMLLPENRAGAKPVLHEIAMEGLSDIPWQATRASHALMFEFAGHISLLPPADPESAKIFFSESTRLYPLESNKSFRVLTQLEKNQNN